MKSLRDRLEYVMHEMGWERGDLVRVSGESHSVVTQWLNGATKQIGSIETACRLEDATGFRAVWLANGKGTPRVASPHQITNADLLLLEAVKALRTPEYLREIVEQYQVIVNSVRQSIHEQEGKARLSKMPDKNDQQTDDIQPSAPDRAKPKTKVILGNNLRRAFESTKKKGHQ